MKLAALPAILAFVTGGAAASKLSSTAGSALRLQASAGTTQGMEHAAYLTVVETFAGLVPQGAPEWCRNDTNLSWTQRKQRMQQHWTLQWAKEEVKKMRAAKPSNTTVPTWMADIVDQDSKRGRMKWAVQEARHLKEQGKPVPEWMAQMVEEDAKWANRWAACKASELKSQGEEPPRWMIDNGRKGIMEYADEKATELQRQIDELEASREREDTIAEAKGDLKLARKRNLAYEKVIKTRSVSEQMKMLEAALEQLSTVERARRAGGVGPFKVAAVRAKDAYDLLGRILQAKMDAIKRRLTLAGA